MKRRALLSVSVAAAFGGCFGVGQAPRSRLAWIWLQNDHNDRHEVDVLVEDGEETVFSDRRTLAD